MVKTSGFILTAIIWLQDVNGLFTTGCGLNCDLSFLRGHGKLIQRRPQIRLSQKTLGCFLPSLLIVKNIEEPGEEAILSANYHNYSIMAILDEFLMKCALVSLIFHNFQV